MNVPGDDFDRASLTDNGTIGILDDDATRWAELASPIADLGRELNHAERLVIDAFFRCAYNDMAQLYHVYRADIHDDFRSHMVALALSTSSGVINNQEVPILAHPQQSDMRQLKMVCLYQLLNTPMSVELQHLFTQGDNDDDAVAFICPIWEGLFSTGRAAHNIILIMPDIMRVHDVSGARLLRVYDFFLCAVDIDGTQEVPDDALAVQPVQSREDLVQALDDAGEFDSTMNWIMIAAAAFMRLAILTGITLTARDLSRAPSKTLQLLNGFLQDDEFLHTSFLEIAAVIHATYVAGHLTSGHGHFIPPVQHMLYPAFAQRRVDYLLLDICAALADFWLRRALYRARTPLLLLSPFLGHNHQLLSILLAAILSTQDHVTPARAKEITASPIGRFTVQLCAR